MLTKLKSVMLGAVIVSTTLLTAPSAEAFGSRSCSAEQEALNNAVAFLIQVRNSGENNEALEDLAEDMVKQAFSAWSRCDMAR